MFKRNYPRQRNLQNSLHPIPNPVMPSVLIRCFPAIAARSAFWTQHAKEPCSTSITKQCQSVSGPSDAFLHSQLELIRPFPSPPEKHIKPPCTTVFPKLYYYFISEQRCMLEVRAQRPESISQSGFKKSFCHNKLVHVVRSTY